MDERKRVVVLVDGFNLYHAIKELNWDPSTGKKLQKAHLRWLDLWALSKAIIHPSRDNLVSVYWFSAFADWIPSDSKIRHQVYCRALRSTGVQTILGNFKKKPRKCPKCRHEWAAHEEKESDVNLAIQLVRLAFKDGFDKAIIFSADTDLAPAIKMVKETHPTKEVHVAIPARRLQKTNALVSAAHGKIKLRESHFANNLLPKHITTGDGNGIIRPEYYDPPTTLR